MAKGKRCSYNDAHRIRTALPGVPVKSLTEVKVMLRFIHFSIKVCSIES
jgi:hypothetical protein